MPLRKRFPLLLFICLLAGCNIPRSTPTPEPVTTDLPFTQCAWSWSTQSLPELSAKVEAAMQTAGLKGVTVRAEAYGENCISPAGKVDHFAAMETDFHITLQIDSLTDTEKLGSPLEEILVVLDAFPTGSIPGPQPGYIGISFRNGNDELNLWFTATAGESARALGLHEAALFEELQKK